ncbi:hypothetical protein COV93_04770 [Candidatus Woesearchaeota archaeon CG11_big_fil_rev_8_21_14_0_20_43_8]|nr:MAG: hypothetical protein COV93_04770 [Candidatus Woesearchaeota archaeon CG11_big_fil_rev_8_21_14_0_20_43_8]PIO05067.1 MAG: hypothetical protein COT47_06395 [Candidatus Woesearchaeota archaeon CG08_land_8_20_14_0_20_43_7]
MPLIKFVLEKEDKFVMDWMEELGWDANPFDDGLLEPIDDFIAGYNEERGKLNIFVISKNPFGILKGPKGTGKTMLFKWLINQLHEHTDRVNCLMMDGALLHDEHAFIQAVVKPHLGFFEKIFSRRRWGMLDSSSLPGYLKPKLKRRRLVLLIDNVDKLEKHIAKTVNYLLDADLNMQIIVAGTKAHIEKVKLHYHKDDLGIELQKLSYEDLRDMIKRRIEFFGGEDIVPFTDTLLKKIAMKANNNPQEMIKMCRNLAVKSTVFHKHKGDDKDLAPPEPKGEKHDPEKLEKIKKKVGTINYIKSSKKKKPDVEVIENRTASPSEDEYADLDEKEKNDQLISELFDKK